MKKKVLIVGNSASAYALAKKMSKEHDVYMAPKNELVTDFATSIDIREDSINELLDFVMENDINMTIPVSETTLKSNIVSIFSNNNQQIFAPAQKAAEQVINKAYAKKMLYRLHIPTPKFGIFEKENVALDYIKNQSVPYIFKTNDPNSAVVLTSEQMGKMFVSAAFKEKNAKVIIEDYVYGTSFSFYAITDGYKALPIGSSLNYRFSLEGEGGQITGGMGACTPNYKLSLDNEYFIMDNVIYPVIEQMCASGNPYLGILGVNGVISSDGKISVLGLEAFLQDSNSDAVLNNIDEDIYELFESCIIGSFSDEKEYIRLKEQYSVALTLSCRNNENKENVIQGMDKLDEETLVSLYPAVTKNKYLEYEASNGANIVITSTSPTITSASRKVYEEAECINFKGLYYRKDICKEPALA